ncbi:MAG TPA: hypothetical protein VND65_17635 [Candidatus Binatia bacterium]|nr:hypothetical protein [Candidatus Binatia bacterium]
MDKKAETAKRKIRKELAGLSFTEKTRILESLRDRSLAFELVRVFLVPNPKDGIQDRDHVNTLQRESQKYLNSHLKGGPPNASRSALSGILSGWISGAGRKVRFEIQLDGESKGKEISSKEELDKLIGRDQTPAAFLRALAKP